MAVGVYVDGFNLYYGLFRNSARRKKVPTRYKWLDLRKTAQMLLPRERIDYVGYFTAPVNSQRSRQQARRQRAYIQALETRANLEIIFGNFRWVSHKGTRSQDGHLPYQEFWHWEEKGSDVNLAMRMVRDACTGTFDKMLVISNDSDLVGPVAMVVNDYKIPVIQVSPGINTNKAFIGVATSCIIIQPARLARCMLPEKVTTAHGISVTRPAAWK